MKRDKIEIMVGWLDALRRDDRGALLATLEPAYEVEALELIGAERHAILHVRGGGVPDIELEDGVYNVFQIAYGRITRIDDYADRDSALRAARLV